MKLDFQILLYASNGKKISSTVLSKARYFNIYVKIGSSYVKWTILREEFDSVSDSVASKTRQINRIKKLIKEEFAIAQEQVKKPVPKKPVVKKPVEKKPVAKPVAKPVVKPKALVKAPKDKFFVRLYDNNQKPLKETLLSKTRYFDLFVWNGKEYELVTDSPIEFEKLRLPAIEKRDLIDSYKMAFDEDYIPAATAQAREKALHPTKAKLIKIVRKTGPKLGDIVLGYPPLDPPRKVDKAERQVIRGQARLKLQEQFLISGVEANEIINAMFIAFKKNLPLIPKLLEEFLVVYYMKHKTDKRAQVKRLLAGREVSTAIEERPYLKGQLSQIDTLLKLSLIKVEKEIVSVTQHGKTVKTLSGGESARTTKDGDVKIIKNGSLIKTYRDADMVEELVSTDHLFAKVIATYRGNMEMSLDDIGGSEWRDEVFQTVITDVLNVFQGFVDNGVFQYSNRPEYIIRIICPLFDKDSSVHESLKTSSGNKRYGLGISLDRTFFESLDDVRRHLKKPDTQHMKTPELDKVSLFDRVKNRLRSYLQLNHLNAFAITGFTIERLIWE